MEHTGHLAGEQWANWAGLMARLASFIFSKNIRMIHCWGTPVGSIGYLLSLLTARKLTIDSYEPHAEAMVENGTWKRNGLAFQILFMLERLQTRRATHLIAVNSGMKEYARNKYDVDLNQLLVKPACVDLNLFSGVNIKKPHLIHDLGLKDKIVCVYAGKFGGIYLEKEVFDFLHEAGIHWGKKFRMLLLTSHSPEQINKLCLLSGVDPSIVLVRFVPHSEVADYMGLGDFGLTPVKPVPTKKYCSPIKDGEYWALGLPVVITSNISEDSDIIHANNIGAVLERLDSDSYKQAVSEIDRLLHLEELQRRRKIRAIATRYRSFEIAQSVYEKIYGG